MRGQTYIDHSHEYRGLDASWPGIENSLGELLVICKVVDRSSAGHSRASRTALLIAEDFYGDRLDLASRDMAAGAAEATQATNSATSAPRVEGQSWLNMPEVGAVQRLCSSGREVETGQDSSRLSSVRYAERIRSLGGNERDARLFLTFISAMNRARNATQLWSAGMRLYGECPEIFDPHHVAELEFNVLRTMLKDARVAQRHAPDTNAWHQIAKSLSSGLKSPVTRVIDAGLGDAQDLLRDLKMSRDDSGRARFPMLRGPKVGPMWIRMMVNPGRARVDRIETVPVAVDVQVRRVTENLGVTPTRDLTLRKAKPIIQQTWMSALSEADIGGPAGISGTCAALDPALWFFGKHGCGHCKKAAKKVRFGRACDFCVRFG